MRYLTSLFAVLILWASAVCAQSTQTVSVVTPVSVTVPTGCNVTSTVTTTAPQQTQITVTCPTVTPPPPPLAIAVNPLTLPQYTVGKPYSANLATLAGVTGGVPPYTFAATSSLPNWATLSSTGVLSGTPTFQKGGGNSTPTFTINYTVTDSSTAKASLKSVVLKAAASSSCPVPASAVKK